MVGWVGTFTGIPMMDGVVSSQSVVSGRAAGSAS